MKIEQVKKIGAIQIVRISTRIRKQRPDTNSSVSHFYPNADDIQTSFDIANLARWDDKKDIYRRNFSTVNKLFYIPIPLKMIYIIEVVILCLIGEIAIIFS